MKSDKRTTNYRKIVGEIAGGMVEDILDRKQIPVRIAVYDGQEFLGYKVDSAWTLDDVRFKAHPLKDAKPTAHLTKNLLYLINKKGYNPKCSNILNSRKKIDIVVEEIDLEGNSLREQIRYSLRAGKDNKYYLKISKNQRV